MYRSSPFRSTLNMGYITALDMCEVCTEAVYSVAVGAWSRKLAKTRNTERERERQLTTVYNWAFMFYKFFLYIHIYIPTNSYMVWNFSLSWKIRLFQFSAEISDCRRDFKFGSRIPNNWNIIKKNGSGEIFCPGREFPIRSIFKTELIRTKIVDWGFSRYIYIHTYRFYL